MSAAKLQARLRAENLVQVSELDIDKVQIAADGTRKLRLRTADNRLIESVLIPDDDARQIIAGQLQQSRTLDAYDDEEEAPTWERKKDDPVRVLASRLRHRLRFLCDRQAGIWSQSVRG